MAMTQQAAYLFNPEQDLAMAYGGDNYTAPPFARQLQRDLRLLPAWLAPAGSLVVVDERDVEADNQWLMSQGLDVQAASLQSVAALPSVQLRPWGWNATLRKRLLSEGVADEWLPTPDELAWMRRLAHRRTTIALHRRIADGLGHQLCPQPVELQHRADVLDFMHAHSGCYLKQPWSGSGRGIYHVFDADNDPHAVHWVEGALQRQGSLLCEVALDKVQDFAVEFACADGDCRLTGYSVFACDRHSQFESGVVDSSAALHAYLSSCYAQLDHVVEVVRQALLSEVAPHYNGPVGVDMMLYRSAPQAIAINPCVEVNLRTTMGMVTSALGERHGLRGRYVITTCDDVIGRNLLPCDQQTRYRAMIIE